MCMSVHTCGHERCVCIVNPLCVCTGLGRAIWGEHTCTSMYACMCTQQYSCLLQILRPIQTQTDLGALKCVHTRACVWAVCEGGEM